MGIKKRAMSSLFIYDLRALRKRKKKKCMAKKLDYNQNKSGFSGSRHIFMLLSQHIQNCDHNPIHFYVDFIFKSHQMEQAVYALFYFNKEWKSNT